MNDFGEHMLCKTSIDTPKEFAIDSRFLGMSDYGVESNSFGSF
jgi:hypothetical protein